MTCIAAIAEGGTVWMGADSAGSNGSRINTRADPKIYEVGEMLIGFTTSYRMGQLLGYKLCLPHHHTDVSILDYLHNDFIDAVRETLKSGGYAREDCGAETGGTFLVGYRGRIFQVESDFQIGEQASNYDAVGSGVLVALGALYATSGVGLSPEKRIKIALRAAEEHAVGVRGPIVLKSLPDNETFEDI